ncbi:MAG: methyltransferase domain-containing protein [Planctomycetaceae bacterium]|nr:methyltransferase domain-containing protein [Planctomycetaceae bacterium]
MDRDNTSKPKLASFTLSETPARNESHSQKPAHLPTGDAESPQRKPRVGILIVAYNALTTLVSVLKRIPHDVWEEIEEVAVFDDASHDETYELAVGFKQLHGIEKLTIIRNEVNQGYGGNQKRGYKYFLDKGFDAVVLLHGDGQYAPEMLADLYRPIVEGRAEAVFGSRMMKDFGGPLKGGMPLYKYVGNRILTTYSNVALGMKLTEFHSGYRAYSLKALRKVDFTHMTNEFHFDTEIIVKLHHQGFRITEVPIPTYYGKEICHVNGMKYAKDVVRSVMRYKRTVRSVGRHPEYQEFFVHYPLKDSRNSSHDYFERWCGSHNSVLDAGCGEGYFAARIARNDNRVTGIDVLEEPLCKTALSTYHRGNLERGLSDAADHLEPGSFDRVLLQDVLEHIRNPRPLLDDCAQQLSPSGQLLVSVPNVANITVRLNLLLGRFDYTERGILDQDHVHLFTRKSICRLLDNCGYEVLECHATVMPIELAVGLPARHWLMRFTNRVLSAATRVMPNLFGYQVILVARPRQGGAVVRDAGVTKTEQQRAAA